MLNSFASRWLTLSGALLSVLLAVPQAKAADLNLSNIPLFVAPSVPPMNMLVMGRDHKLYYEAYNDHSDLDDDGRPDTGYKPGRITYYGYFDSFKCYTYSSGGNGSFTPAGVTTNKQCSGQWSGDFLNYLTMTRIDALRKVLYGGLRFVDSDSSTVLARSHVPQDAHSWGKEYTSTTVDGYDISLYAPLSQPAANTRHLFANTTLLNDSNQLPLLRVLQNQSVRVWNWVSIERPVAGDQVVTGVNSSGGEIRTGVSPTNYTVRVAVCASGLLEANCKRYPDGNFKPTGLLHEYGENESMYFGLLMGSYAKNVSGGVLRRQMGSIADEIDSDDGTFLSYNGIITTLNRLRTTGFGGEYEYSCGSTAAGRSITNGDCQMWGNPIGEMMYESLRYFAGKAVATSAFSIGFGTGEESQLAGGGLPVATWDNPYSGRPVCSKSFETVISDVNNSYDTDQLPGVDPNFGSFTGDLDGLNVSARGQTIWDAEVGGSGEYFIGQVGASTNGAPTVKTVSSFGNIRGLSPEEPTKRGGYYPASVANYGISTDINSVTGSQTVSTFAVALASPLPKIEIRASSGQTITLVPFAKTVGGAFGITAAGSFQPTNQIVDFYVDSLDETSGKFRVNFEDVEQGNDHDMDAIAAYSYVVDSAGITITLDSEYAAGSARQHMGFVISGTTEDGTYLPVRDRDTSAGDDPDYVLDTPNIPGALPLTWSKTFAASTTPSASILKDPLWYAAKWGGFQDSDGDGTPNLRAEWDADPIGSPGYGLPDNYFLVTNALTLSEQLRKAFEEIVRRNSSASAASVNSGAISLDTAVFQAKFDTETWSGQLLAKEVNPKTGVVSSGELWDAAKKLPDPGSRQIITVNPNGTAVPFRWNDLDAVRRVELSSDVDISKAMVDYLRGDATQEAEDSKYGWRERDTKLGDIVNSSPLYIAAPRAGYANNLESKPYSAFVTAKKNRTPMIYVGANDGMLHGFNATKDGGQERMGFIPAAVFANLKELPLKSYSHRYFVDGSPNAADVFIGDNWQTVLVGGLNKGGQSVYALNVTDPSTVGNAEGAPDNVFMWEFTDKSDLAQTGSADLGYTFGQPAIGRMHNGKWAAVFGNGYNNTAPDGTASTTGNAVLYIVDIADGSIIRKFDTKVGVTDDPTGAGRPNGLATPVLVDTDADRVVDHAYAGDLFGNMWKFDLRDPSKGNWKFSFSSSGDPLPLFQAKDGKTPANAQPITVRPEVARGPYGAGVMVLFGTGKYLEGDDKLLTPERVQSFYGLLDRNTHTDSDRITSRSDLVQQTIDDEDAIDPDGSGPKPARDVRITSSKPVTGPGWYLDLLSPSGYQAEKQVSNPVISDGRLVFSTLRPDENPCAFGGKSWVMILDLLSGARLPDAQIDTNGDGKFTSTDTSISGFATNQIVGTPAILLCLTGDCNEEGGGGVADPDPPDDPDNPDDPTDPDDEEEGGGCPGDQLVASGSSGDLTQECLKNNKRVQGRQSWRKIR